MDQAGKVADKAMFSTEAAARASLVKIDAFKWFLIRSFELLFGLLVRVLAPFDPSRANPQGNRVGRILVVEYWNLGDMVLILPLLRNLRLHYPGSKITLLGNSKVACLLEGQNLVDEVVNAPIPWARHFSRWRKYNPFSLIWLEFVRTLIRLRAQRFDLGLTGRMDIRDNFILWAAGIRRRVGYGVGGGACFLTDRVPPDLRFPHRSRLWLRLIEALGKNAFVTRPELLLDSSQRNFARQFLEEHGLGANEVLIGIHPGARIPTRQWGVQNFEAVAKKLTADFPIKILWFAEPGNVSDVPLEANWLLPVPLELRQFLSVLACCRLLICNDSGPMHLAGALGVPVVAVFGPQEPNWFGPISPSDQVVIKREFWCRPCFDYCKFDQPYCLRTISADDVYEAATTTIKSILSSPRLLQYEGMQSMASEAKHNDASSKSTPLKTRQGLGL